MKFRDILRMQREPTQYEKVIEKKVKKAKMVLSLLNDGIVSLDLAPIYNGRTTIKYRYHIPSHAAQIVATFENTNPLIKVREIIIEPLDEGAEEFKHDEPLGLIYDQFKSYGVVIRYTDVKITFKEIPQK